MTKKTITLTNNMDGSSLEFPILEGSVGPMAMDMSTLYPKTGLFSFDQGFMSTASCHSSLTYIDGDAGILRYRGYPIEQLAEKSNFLETAYLLLHGELPSAEQLEIRLHHQPPHDGQRGADEVLQWISLQRPPHGDHGRRGRLPVRFLS